jgi:hypothetical protein
VRASPCHGTVRDNEQAFPPLNSRVVVNVLFVLVHSLTGFCAGSHGFHTWLWLWSAGGWRLSADCAHAPISTYPCPCASRCFFRETKKPSETRGETETLQTLGPTAAQLLTYTHAYA